MCPVGVLQFSWRDTIADDSIKIDSNIPLNFRSLTFLVAETRNTLQESKIGKKHPSFDACLASGGLNNYFNCAI